MPQEAKNQFESAPTIRLISTREAGALLEDDVLVVPSYDKWNDFGYVIRAEVGLLLSNGSREWLSAFFAIKDNKNLAHFVSERLANSEIGIALGDLGASFASLLIESKSYSLIRRLVGAEAGRRLLLAIHDISLLQSEDEDVPGWSDFFVSEVFTHSMTRSSEGYFAFRRGALILSGRRISGVDARQSVSVDLTRYGPKLHFDFQFDRANSLRGRIAVIIGRNGCGKTSSLSRLAAGFGTDKRQGVSFAKRPDVNQVLVFAHSGALRHFKQRVDRPGAASVRAFALDPSSSLRAARQERQTKLLVDIARAEDGDFEPLDNFKEIVAKEFSDLTLLVPIRVESDIFSENSVVVVNGHHYAPLKSWAWMKGGEQRKLSAVSGVDHGRDFVYLDREGKSRELSLGQAAFINFSLNALANAGPASVILIDEPENFLHPNLVSRFMRVLHQVVEGTKSIAILATHSPFVVREVQSAQVHVIRQSAGSEGLEVVHPRLQTLGANVASIADEVFGDDLPEHLFELVLSKSGIGDLPFEQILNRYAGELSTEALMYLRRRQQAQGDEGAK